jgi:rod shape-determining protein MreB and related proteins
LRVLDILRPPLVAIDVGTATTRILWRSGAVGEELSVVREDLHGRVVARPVMRGGVVADIGGVANVIGALLERRCRTWRRRPAAVVCAPTDVSGQERDALVEAVAAGGASIVCVAPEPLAAAIGAGVDLSSAYATTIVDIGDGVTDLAVLRNGTIVFSDAKRIGCGTLRAAIHDWLEIQRQGKEELSEETVERIVRSYCRLDPITPFVTPQQDSSIRISRDDLDLLLEPVIDAIAAFVATTLQSLPDALAAEVIESGICMTGGGAKLGRLVRSIEARVGLPVRCADEPLTAVIRGAAAMLRNAPLLFAQRPL